MLAFITLVIRSLIIGDLNFSHSARHRHSGLVTIPFYFSQGRGFTAKTDKNKSLLLDAFLNGFLPGAYFQTSLSKSKCAPDGGACENAELFSIPSHGVAKNMKYKC